MVSLQPKRVVGSMTLPIYIYDCHVLGLTNNLIFKENAEKPENHFLNFLFKPERNFNRSVIRIQNYDQLKFYFEEN